MAAKFKINNFGNDRECNTVDEVAEAIKNYRGKSISILYQPDRGLARTLFVDVSPAGVLTESYGTHRAIELRDLLKKSSARYTAGRVSAAAENLPAPSIKGHGRTF
jgi:nucleoside-diphosphate-sugar epimerase